MDILLRLVMIEKKTAAKYHLHVNKHGDAISNHGDTADDEESPLLAPPPQDLTAYKLPPSSSKILSKIPILACFRNSSFLTALFIGFIQSMLLGAFDATVPMVALENYHFDSSKAGLLFLALGIPTLLLGPLFGHLVDKYGAKLPASISYAYLSIVLLCLRFVKPGGSEQVRDYAIILVFCGIGLGAIDAPSLVESSLVVDRYFQANPDHFGEMGPYAQLYGLNSMVFSAGFTIGPLLAGWLRERFGYGNMNAVLALFCFVASILSARYLGGKSKWRIHGQAREQLKSI
jgi:MFS family permease